jgi:GNAT superfamily N-acetyltransferase
MLELFMACDLAKFEPVAPREDVQIEWFEDTRSLQPRHREFLQGYLGLRTRMVWSWQLRGSGAWLALATWNQMIAAYLLVQIKTGGGLRRYAPLMRDRSCVVGPAGTIPAARGHGIYPYLMNASLERCKNAGLACVYAAPQYQNEASIRGMQKDKNWAFVGRLLLRRSIGAPFFHIAAVTLEDPTLTCLIP